jgi:RND superfamily putative drug exporter
VALDATLLRVVLVPALIVLAGRANWWWPARPRPAEPASAPALPSDGPGGLFEPETPAPGETRS